MAAVKKYAIFPHQLGEKPSQASMSHGAHRFGGGAAYKNAAGGERLYPGRPPLSSKAQEKAL